MMTHLIETRPAKVFYFWRALIALWGVCFLLATDPLSADPMWTPANGTGCLVWNRFPVPNESVSWTGGCVDGKIAGPGTLKWSVDSKPNGTYVVGDAKAGQLHGLIKFSHPSGERLVCTYVDGKAQGHGTHTQPNGEEYVGDFVNGKYHGQGTYSYPTGEKYVGEFAAGARQGQGVLTWKFNGAHVRIEGTFRDGLIVHGTLAVQGAPWRWVGPFNKGIPSGRGKVVFADGNEFAASWDSRSQPVITVPLPQGGKYVGHFQGYTFQGQGQLTFPNGFRYVGQFVNNQFHGQGQLTFPNGNKYVGQFEDSKYEGHGTLSAVDGHRYVGGWRRGKYHGKGTMHFPNGVRVEATFVDGNASGAATRILPNGATIPEFYPPKAAPSPSSPAPSRQARRAPPMGWRDVVLNPNSAYNRGLRKRNDKRTLQRTTGHWGLGL